MIAAEPLQHKQTSAVSTEVLHRLGQACSLSASGMSQAVGTVQTQVKFSAMLYCCILGSQIGIIVYTHPCPPQLCAIQHLHATVISNLQVDCIARTGSQECHLTCGCVNTSLLQRCNALCDSRKAIPASAILEVSPLSSSLLAIWMSCLLPAVACSSVLRSYEV